MKYSYTIISLAALLCLFMGTSPCYAAANDNGALTSAQQEKLQTIVRDKLLSGPTAGNPKGDVAVIEFFDYQCGYCRKEAGNIVELIKTDPKLRVVFKDSPIYKARSEFAARAALAANRQGKYLPLYLALMKVPMPLTEDDVLNAAQSAGLDMKKLQAAMDDPTLQQELKSNIELAMALNLPGTPAFVVMKANKMVFIPGAIDLANLKKVISEVRRGRAE